MFETIDAFVWVKSPIEPKHRKATGADLQFMADEGLVGPEFSRCGEDDEDWDGTWNIQLPEGIIRWHNRNMGLEVLSFASIDNVNYQIELSHKFDEGEQMGEVSLALTKYVDEVGVDNKGISLRRVAIDNGISFSAIDMMMVNNNHAEYHILAILRRKLRDGKYVRIGDQEWNKCD